MYQEKIEIEKPEKLKAKNIIYWAEKDGILLGNMKSKAIKFLENDCIKETEKGYNIIPILGYNVTTHKVTKKDNEMFCTCQYNKKYLKECSHIKSVILYEFQKRYEKSRDGEV